MIKNKNKTKNNSKLILLNDKENNAKKLANLNKERFDKNNLLTNKILEIKEFELDSLDYQEALKIDHRNYCQYYCHLLKYNHSISFSFSFHNDYNIQIIKKFLFFFSFSLDFTINALFFTDKTIHKIYQDKGEFNFLYQLPQILCSTLIGKFIDSLIKNLGLSQDYIIALKHIKIKKNLKREYKKLIRTFNLKFILFFVIDFVLIVFFCYYISCFCCIYMNTQIHLIKDTLISLITSVLFPFAIYLIPGIFRISSLALKKSSRKCLYNFSIFFENYLL